MNSTTRLMKPLARALAICDRLGISHTCPPPSIVPGFAPWPTCDRCFIMKTASLLGDSLPLLTHAETALMRDLMADCPLTPNENFLALAAKGWVTIDDDGVWPSPYAMDNFYLKDGRVNLAIVEA